MREIARTTCLLVPIVAAAMAPLMSALGAAGLADPLTKAGLNIYGYAEAGYMYDASAPNPDDGPTYLGFNNHKKKALLNKVSLNLERVVDPTQQKWDLGFRVEGIYGADAAWIHSNGMGDNQKSFNQWDLLQAYAEVTLPGTPVKIRVGKWIELAGFEQFSANIYGAFGDPARALYSYSYQFLYAEPGTQTGALATYVLNPQWTFDAGITRGWNQSTKDANPGNDFLGRVTYTPSDKTTVIFVTTIGPEYPIGVGRNLPPGDDHTWTALDLVITQKLTDNLSHGLGFDYVQTAAIPGLDDGTKRWGGVADYLSYACNDRITLNSRLEWYRDAADGYSVGAASNTTFYAATLGVAIKPFPSDATFSHLLFRPEIRYDRANEPVFADGDRQQVTFSVDALATF